MVAGLSILIWRCGQGVLMKSDSIYIEARRMECLGGGWKYINCICQILCSSSASETNFSTLSAILIASFTDF